MKNKPAMQTRIVGVYRSRGSADDVANQLVNRGILRNQIYISHVGEPKEILHNPARQESVFNELKNFFHSIFDETDREKIQEAYAAVKKSNLVVSVDAHNEDQTEKINAFMSDTYRSHREKTMKKDPEKPQPPADKAQKNRDAAASDIPPSLVFTNIFDKDPDKN